MSAFIAFMAAVSVFLFMIGIRLYRTVPEGQQALARLAREEGGEPQQKQSYFERRIRPLARSLSNRFRSFRPLLLPAKAEQLLIWAGYPHNLDLDEIFGLQLLASLGSCLFGFFVGSSFWGTTVGILAAILLGVGGVFLPILWLDGEANKRQRAINLAVPGSLELLATCVEAGMGFDEAMRHVAEGMKGPLAEEYLHFLRELRMGVPRQECFRRLLSRNKAEELRVVVGALMQGQELGVPVARTLEIQAAEMRERRIQRAKEMGAKASPKIALVTTMLIAPAVMCLFLSVIIFGVGRDVFPFLREFFGGG